MTEIADRYRRRADAFEVVLITRTAPERWMSPSPCIARNCYCSATVASCDNGTAMERVVTRELSTDTWPDYERFFSQGNGWDHCGCTAYHGIRAPRELRKWAEKRDWNLAVKCDLVERGQSHGVLVYSGDEPIGWCQFGPAAELPVLRVGRRPEVAPTDDGPRRWRITCFCTDKRWREQGISELALGAALEVIRREGGGVVEAFPVAVLPADPLLDELIHLHGGESPQVDAYLKANTGGTQVTYYDRRPFAVDGVAIRDVGPVKALVRRMPGALHPGTVAMFERAGFDPKAVIPARGKLGTSRVVTEKSI